jgi:MFS family permease
MNGLSFIFSGACLPLVKIPNVRRREKPRFFKDMADGFRYMWRQKGLRFILILAALINFFCSIAIMLFLPMCQSDPTLGSGKYGLLMASFMGGSVIGFTAMSIISVKPKDKMRVFVVASVLSNALTLTAVNQPFYAVMIILLVFAGLFNAIVNVQLISTVQTSVPSEMRGKVMSFMTAATQGLTPFAMALGGLLGGLLPIRIVITASFAIGFLIMATSYFSKSFREYLTQDHAAVMTPLPVEGF